MSVRLVVENSDDERRRRWAEGGLRAPLRTLAANFLRIIRGAGHPERMVRQIADLREAFEQYQAAFGHWPPPEVIHSALQIEDRYVDRPLYNDATRDDLRRLDDNRSDAAAEVQRASLQIFASSLLDQTPQLKSGEHDFWASFYQTRDAHDAYRAAWDRSLAPKPVSRPKRPARRPPKSK